MNPIVERNFKRFVIELADTNLIYTGNKALIMHLIALYLFGRQSIISSCKNDPKFPITSNNLKKIFQTLINTLFEICQDEEEHHYIVSRINKACCLSSDQFDQFEKEVSKFIKYDSPVETFKTIRDSYPSIDTDTIPIYFNMKSLKKIEFNQSFDEYYDLIFALISANNHNRNRKNPFE